jgi:hypothetical protein
LSDTGPVKNNFNLNPHWFKSEKLYKEVSNQVKYDPDMTNMLRALKDSEVIPLSCGLKVVKTSSSMPTDLSNLFFASDSLFVRSFYESLFDFVRKCKRVCVVGNSGTSKSAFQWYCIKKYFEAHSGSK